MRPVAAPARCRRRRASAPTVSARASSSRRADTWCFRGPACRAAAPAGSPTRAVGRAAGSSARCEPKRSPSRFRRGLADGARIRVPGKGHAGLKGGEAGDLLINVLVEPHPLFRRDGDDLHLTVPIAIHEAALGARLEVPALDGVARLRIPPGTQSGQRFRLRERGVPSSRDGRRGDLVVEVRLVLPRVLDERSKELLREFGRLNAEDVRKDLTTSAQSRHRRRWRRGSPDDEEERQGLLHDQRGRAEVQHPSADAAPLRARRSAQAVADRGQYPALFRRGSRAARNHSLAHARSRASISPASRSS